MTKYKWILIWTILIFISRILIWPVRLQSIRTETLNVTWKEWSWFAHKSVIYCFPSIVYWKKFIIFLLPQMEEMAGATWFCIEVFPCYSIPGRDCIGNDKYQWVCALVLNAQMKPNSMNFLVVYGSIFHYFYDPQ